MNRLSNGVRRMTVIVCNPAGQYHLWITHQRLVESSRNLARHIYATDDGAHTCSNRCNLLWINGYQLAHLAGDRVEVPRIQHNRRRAARGRVTDTRNNIKIGQLFVVPNQIQSVFEVRVAGAKAKLHSRLSLSTRLIVRPPKERRILASAHYRRAPDKKPFPTGVEVITIAEVASRGRKAIMFPLELIICTECNRRRELQLH